MIPPELATFAPGAILALPAGLGAVFHVNGCLCGHDKDVAGLAPYAHPGGHQTLFAAERCAGDALARVDRLRRAR